MELNKNILCYLVLVTSSFYSQVTILSGTVLDEKQKPISFANIYLSDKSNGVIADANGVFELKVENIKTNSIIFSCLGYKSLSLRLDQWESSQPKFIILLSDPNVLQEIKIIDSKFKIRELNYPDESKMSFGAAQPEFEYATFIPNKKKYTGFIKDVSVFITNIGYPFAPFRIHIYEINPISNEPGKELTKHSLVFNSKTSNVWFKINLDTLNIQLPINGFFVGIEALPFKEYIVPTSRMFDSLGNQLRNGNINSFQNILYLGTVSYFHKKGIVSYSRKYLHAWNSTIPNHLYSKNNSVGYCTAIKTTISYKLVNKNGQNNNDSIDIDFEKNNKKTMKNILSEIDRYDNKRYPHSTIKEFFESNLKAIKDNNIPYLFTYLYLVTKDEKESFILEMNERNKSEQLFSNEEIVNGTIFFQYCLNNINESTLTNIKDDLYLLIFPNKTYIYFLKKKGKWFAYPKIIEYKDTKNNRLLFK